MLEREFTAFSELRLMDIGMHCFGFLAERCSDKYNKTIRTFQDICAEVFPNSTRLALAEYTVSVIEDGTHQWSGSKYALPTHTPCCPPQQSLLLSIRPSSYEVPSFAQKTYSSLWGCLITPIFPQSGNSTSSDTGRVWLSRLIFCSLQSDQTGG